MVANLEFLAVIKGGQLSAVEEHIASFLRRMESKQAKINLSWNIKKRTIKQNKFYWKTVVSIVREWLFEQGYNLDADETHKFIVRRIWKLTKVIVIDDEPYEEILSSTRLSTKEWEDRIELTRVYMAKKKVMIPFPNEQL